MQPANTNNDPRDYAQLFYEHENYKRHIKNIIKIKPQVDNKSPTKFGHIRNKDFKEQLFKKRERQIENNHLVAKILQVKSNNQNTEERQKNMSTGNVNILQTKQSKITSMQQSQSPTNRKSLNSLNFLQRKKELEKIMQENIFMMKKIHYAQPSVQYNEHIQHQQEVKKLKKIIQYNSMRQSMITTVRNFFSGVDDQKSHDDKTVQRMKTASSGLGSGGFSDQQSRGNSQLISRRKQRRIIQSLDLTNNQYLKQQRQQLIQQQQINNTQILQNQSEQTQERGQNLSQEELENLKSNPLIQDTQRDENTDNQTVLNVLSNQEQQIISQINNEQLQLQNQTQQNFPLITQNVGLVGVGGYSNYSNQSNYFSSGNIRPVSTTLNQIKYWKLMQHAQNYNSLSSSIAQNHYNTFMDAKGRKKAQKQQLKALMKREQSLNSGNTKKYRKSLSLIQQQSHQNKVGDITPIVYENTQQNQPISSQSQLEQVNNNQIESETQHENQKIKRPYTQENANKSNQQNLMNIQVQQQSSNEGNQSNIGHINDINFSSQRPSENINSNKQHVHEVNKEIKKKRKHKKSKSINNFNQMIDAAYAMKIQKKKLFL
eukprot:403362468